MKYAMKSGVGTWSIDVKGIVIGALVAVNAVGDVIDPGMESTLQAALAAHWHG